MGMASVAYAQLIGTITPEEHVNMAVQQCSDPNNCWREHGEIVMDMQWRWIRNKDGYNNCLPGEFWDQELCPDPHTCGQNCMAEGVTEQAYRENYKTIPVGDYGLKLEFPNGPRVYMLEDPDNYKMFKLLNKEFTFDVDLSTLPCGMNAALYFIEMNQDGDKNGDPNRIGARHGAGYCDAQCPGMRYIKGDANLLDWDIDRCAMNPDGETKCGGHGGRFGYCCHEMDILEANREAGVYTVHPCTVSGPAVCEGKEECGDRSDATTGYCDKDGCGFSSFRMGDEQFWGPGDSYTVNTLKPMTIVTQFITSDGTDDGDLVEIRRNYVQDGRVVHNSIASILGNDPSKPPVDSITDEMCMDQTKAFHEKSTGFTDAGKLKAMGEALKRGMVLSMSIWDDGFGRMLWLDGEKTFHTQDPSDPAQLGVRRGPCPFKYGTHEDMLEHAEQHGTISVTFSNIKYGPVGSTHAGGRRMDAPTMV